MKELESEKETLQKLANDLDFEKKKLEEQVKDLKQQSTVGKTDQGEQMDKAEFMQLRSMLIRFFELTPMTSKQNEDVLPIIFSMLQINKRESDVLQNKRQ